MNIKKEFQILSKFELDRRNLNVFKNTKDYNTFLRKNNSLIRRFYSEDSFYFTSKNGSYYFIEGNFYDKDYRFLGGKFNINQHVSSYLSINSYITYNKLYFFINTPPKEILSLLNKTSTPYNIFTEEFFNLMFNAPLRQINSSTNALASDFISRYITGELDTLSNVEITDEGLRITRTPEEFLEEIRQEEAHVEIPVVTGTGELTEDLAQPVVTTIFDDIIEQPLEEDTVPQDLPF